LYTIIESLFTVYIQENLNMSRKQIEQLIILTEQNPKIFVTADLIKINRSMSYMTFVFKDIRDFVLKKTNDGVFYEEIRYAKRRIQELKAMIYMA
jgi:hypothetical protein